MKPLGVGKEWIMGVGLEVLYCRGLPGHYLIPGCLCSVTSRPVVFVTSSCQYTFLHEGSQSLQGLARGKPSLNACFLPGI